MKFLFGAMTAWLVAHALKHGARLFGRNRRVFGVSEGAKLFLSGGMPSAHSATVTALTVIIGYYEGYSSSVFALSVLFSAVVIYDALMVRFSSGEQGDLLNELLKEQKSKLTKIRVAHGHRPTEVIAGVAVGLMVAGVVILATHYL